jgi:hypothetical protein
VALYQIPTGIGTNALTWRLSGRRFAVVFGSVLTVLFLGPVLVSGLRQDRRFDRDLTIGGIGWLLSIAFVAWATWLVYRQGIIAEPERIWARTGRRWYGPVEFADVLRVDVFLGQGGPVLYLLQTTAGPRLSWRTAIGTAGRMRPRRYRDLSESTVRYLLVPGWALRDGHLARLLLPALRADVRYGKGAREALIGWAATQRKR